MKAGRKDAGMICESHEEYTETIDLAIKALEHVQEERRWSRLSRKSTSEFIREQKGKIGNAT